MARDLGDIFRVKVTAFNLALPSIVLRPDGVTLEKKKTNRSVFINPYRLLFTFVRVKC